MELKRLFIYSASLLMLSAPAFADVSIANNTNAAATALTTTSPCSSAAGDQGVIKPHSNVVVPQWVVGLYCAFGCDINVYISNNCGGPKIATIHATADRGVTNINNHHVNGYKVVGSGFSASIEQDAPKGWFEKLTDWI